LRFAAGVILLHLTEKERPGVPGEISGSYSRVLSEKAVELLLTT
jgi:hypothetical protein